MIPYDKITEAFLQNLRSFAMGKGLLTEASFDLAFDINFTVAFGRTELTMASGGELIATGAGGAVVAGTLPIAVWAGTWMALGSGYVQAREAAKKAETVSGYSQGFVMGLLDWTWRQVLDRFRRYYTVTQQWDEVMDVIRVNDYHAGLKRGFVVGRKFPASAAKAYAIKLRKLAGIPMPTAWYPRYIDEMEQARARLVQVRYVIDLAAAALKNGIIKLGDA